MRFIKQVGIELEGGWESPPPDAPIGHDGSVKVNSYYVGEVASPPLDPKEIDQWILRNHPHATNETCGTHVHLSFKRILDYARLADRETARKFIIRRLRNWGSNNEWGCIRSDHPFWERLSGENIYCKALWIPQVQIPCTNKPESRRTQLNFCWGVHGTVELRVLPGFKVPEVTLAAIKASIQAFEDYLSIISRRRERKLTTELEMDDDAVVDGSESELGAMSPLNSENDLVLGPPLFISEDLDLNPSNEPAVLDSTFDF
jgi:hypothetical protein